MSDPITSGESGAVPAGVATETPSAPAAPASVPASFGTSRGSGLARGKRPQTSSPAAKPASASRGDYQPSAVQILTAERTYENPFTPAPEAKPEPSPTLGSSPVGDHPAATPTAEAPASSAAPSPTSDVPVSAGTSPAVPEAEESAEKAQLTILPPAENKRTALSWDKESAPPADTPARSRREDRPVFRPERAGDKPAGASSDSPSREFRREPREGREGRERRDYRSEREGRGPREGRPGNEGAAGGRSHQPSSPSPAPQPSATPAKSGGFLGWLKNLFGGPAEETPASQPASTTGERTPREARGYNPRPGGQDGSSRRHRGGQGGGRREFENRGPREGQNQGTNPAAGEREGGPDRSYGDGPRRRRRRGGRGRNRGEFGGASGGGNDTPPAS